MRYSRHNGCELQPWMFRWGLSSLFLSVTLFGKENDILWLLELLCRVAHFPFGHLIAGVLFTSSCYDFTTDKIYRELLQVGNGSNTFTVPRKTSVHSLEEMEKVDSEILQASLKRSIQFFARPKAISASSIRLKGAIAYGKHGDFPVGYEQTEDMLSVPIALLLVMLEQNLILAE